MMHRAVVELDAVPTDDEVRHAELLKKAEATNQVLGYVAMAHLDANGI